MSSQTTSRSSLGKQASLILSGLTCMEYFFESCSDLVNSDKTELNYSLFKDWALKIHFYDPATPPNPNPFASFNSMEHAKQAVKDFLEKALGGDENNLPLYTSDDLDRALNSDSRARTFRVVLGLIHRAKQDPMDHRMRDMFRSLLANRFQVPIKRFICQFFTDRGDKKTRGKFHNKSFTTQLAPTFQQLIFTSALTYLHHYYTSTRKARTRVSSASSSNNGSGTTNKRRRIDTPADAIRLNETTGQRVGYAVQTIILAWNRFASSLGFPGIQEMAAPYIIFDSPFAHLTIIPSNKDGFAPLSQKLNTTLDIAPTTDLSQVDPEAASRPDNVDAAIRSLLQDFKRDVHQAVIDPDLHNTSHQNNVTGLQPYSFTSIHDPTRFQSISKELISTITTFMKVDHHPHSAHPPGPHSDDENEIPQPSSSSPHHPTELDSAQAKELREKIDDAMPTVAALYNCSYNELLDIHIENTGVDLSEQVQLVLTDPPYNVLKAKHDRLKEEEMPGVVHSIGQLLRPGGHVVLFCTAQQFPKWESLFREYDPRLPHAPQPFFNVDSVPMIFTAHPSYNKNNPAKLSCHLNPACEFAVHAKMNGSSFQDQEKAVNYKNFGYVESSFPAYRNVINNIRAPEPKEVVKTKTNKHLRSEQKPISLLKELISRFSHPGDFVVDLFGGTFTTARASFSLTEHRYFIGCELFSSCFVKARRKTIEDFAQIVHHNSSSFVTSLQAQHPQLQDSCKALVEHLSAAMPRRPPPPVLNCWTPLQDMPIYQHLPRKTLSAVATFTKNAAFLDLLHILPENWPRSLWREFNEIDPMHLLIGEASSCSLVVAKSTIKHLDSGLGVFAAKPFRKGDFICNYYGTLLYHALPNTSDTRKEYGQGNFMVTLPRYNSYAIQVHVQGTQFDKVRNISKQGKHIFIVPTQFNVGSYINEWFYMEGDLEKKSYDKKTLQNPRTENVRFFQTPDVCDKARQISHPGVIKVMAHTDINRGDELFTNYRR